MQEFGCWQSMFDGDLQDLSLGELQARTHAGQAVQSVDEATKQQKLSFR